MIDFWLIDNYYYKVQNFQYFRLITDAKSKEEFKKYTFVHRFQAELVTVHWTDLGRFAEYQMNLGKILPKGLKRSMLDTKLQYAIYSYDLVDESMKGKQFIKIL